MTTDSWIHLAEVVAVLGMLWRANRKVTRLLDALIDYPLHRHINGKILYPKGYSPGVIETQDQS